MDFTKLTPTEMYIVLGGLGFIAIFMSLFIWWFAKDRTRRAVEWEKLVDPKNARKMTHYGSTPVRGEYIVVINPLKWVIVRWDKPKNELCITTRPNTYREDDPVQKKYINWIVIKEQPRQKVRWQDYMKRQVM
jgi:hypothetical protein